MAGTSGAAVHKIVIKASECPVTKVTVYKDRAEVCRKLETTVNAGVTEIYVQEFVAVEEDSVRVEGKGNAIIAEVSYQRQFVMEDEATTTEKVKNLKEELNNLVEEKINLDYETQKALLCKQWGILDNFAATASKNGQGNDPTDQKNLQIDSVYLKSMREFLEQYKDIAKRLEADRLDLDRKDKELNKKIDVIESNLKVIHEGTSGRYEKRECLIVLEAEKETKVQLFMSYVVLGASWTPVYDLRMSTDQGILKIFYYGLIRQRSSEDWNDVKLLLSTAQPSIGGTIPVLPTMQLSREKLLYKMTFVTSSVAVLEEEEHDSLESQFLRPKTSSAKSKTDKSETKEGITSATFEIARLSTIPSDFTGHKVAVAIIELKPVLSYVTVPQVVPHAFLLARVTNTSEYTLLAGKTNIFLDNSFVAKAEISAVAPKEEFNCSLGLDPAVRIKYKPLVKINSSSGIISKTQCITYEQTIEIKNMHDYSIKITVRDNLPRSTAEKIKVNLISPCIDPKNPEATEGVRLTKSNHVEWDLDIKGLDKAEVLLKYTVEHPANERVKTTLSYEEE